MPDELRMEKLAQYEGKRITFRGTLGGWRPWSQSHGREYRRAVLKNVEMDGELVANYLSVIRAEAILEVQPEIGDLVELSGLVRSYRNNDGGETDFCIHSPADVRLVNAPAQAIPDPKPVAPKPAAPPPPPPATPPPPAPAPARDLLAAIRPARDFLKVADPERALEVLEAAAVLLEVAGGPKEAARVLQAVQDCL
jgi:hypothetical protein